jgi:hypothetical protein
VLVTICASGADDPLTRGTACCGVVALSAWPSSPLAMFTPVDGDAAAAVGDGILLGPNGVSDRPGNGEAAPEGSLSLGLSKIPCRNTECDAVDRVCAGSAGDWLLSRVSPSSNSCPVGVKAGAEDDCTRLSFSFLL